MPFASGARPKSEGLAGGVEELRVSLPARVLLSEIDGERVGRVFDLWGGSRSAVAGLLGSNSVGGMIVTGTWDGNEEGTEIQV